VPSLEGGGNPAASAPQPAAAGGTSYAPCTCALDTEGRRVYRLRNFHAEKVKAFQAPNGVLKHDVNERCHWLRDPIKCVVEDDGDGQAGAKRKRPSKCHRRYPKSEAICRTTGATAAAILSPPSTERCTRSA
jgi:hypothetical protein